MENDILTSSWFQRLNSFEQQETLRQINYKKKRWPDLPDGQWSKNPQYFYPHIMPEGHLKEVFYPPIAEDVIRYCGSEIAIHSEALNLRSSQVACFNVMFPLKKNLDLAQKALASLLPGVKKVENIEFEYTGDTGATEWLGEPENGKRGQNRTSIDAAIWWKDSSENVLTLVEWKYTERSMGTCGGFKSIGNDSKSLCNLPFTNVKQSKENCYLMKPRNHRHYWDHLGEAGIDVSKLASTNGCPFRDSFYQLLRQFLLAAYLRKDKSIDRVELAVVSFRDNKSLNQVPSYLSSFGGTIIDAWNNILTGVPKLRHVLAEDIASALRSANTSEGQMLSEYLHDRYGL